MSATSASTKYPTVRIRPGDRDLLRFISEKTGQPMTELLSEALRDFAYNALTK